MIPNPKFEQHIKNTITQNNVEKAKPRMGVIISHDKYTNTATVLLSSPDSDLPGDIVKNVPCPIYMGVQTVSPEPGRPCWIAFAGDRDSAPVITHYFNHNFSKYDFNRHYEASNGIPRFVLNI